MKFNYINTYIIALLYTFACLGSQQQLVTQCRRMGDNYIAYLSKTDPDEIAFEDETKQILHTFSTKVFAPYNGPNVQLDAEVYEALQKQYPIKRDIPAEVRKEFEEYTSQQRHRHHDKEMVEDLVENQPKITFSQEEAHFLSRIAQLEHDIKNEASLQEELRKKSDELDAEIAALKNRAAQVERENTELKKQKKLEEEKKLKKPRKRKKKQQSPQPIAPTQIINNTRNQQKPQTTKNKKSNAQLIGDARRLILKEYKMKTLTQLESYLEKDCIINDKPFIYQKTSNNSYFFTYCLKCNSFKIHINGTEGQTSCSKCGPAVCVTMHLQQKTGHSSSSASSQ